MRNLKIAICEDSEEDRENLLSLIIKNEPSAEVLSFSNGKELTETFRAGKFDLIFMDIYLKDSSGITVVDHIRQKDSYVSIAFVTSSLDHALDGYRLRVGRYIEKPAQEEAVLDALKYAHEAQHHIPHLTLCSNGTKRALPFNQILFIEQRAHDLFCHLTDNRMVEATGRLKDITEQLPKPPFFSCHKSYIVNMDYVDRMDRELMAFHMLEGEDVQISRSKKTEAAHIFEDFMADKARRSFEEH